MPELPETETMARQMTASVVGRRLGAPRVTRPGVLRDVDAATLGARTQGRRVVGAWRRAKMVVLDLDGGDRIVLHPKMTGAPLVVARGAAVAHECVRWPLDDGRDLVWRDIRRFGTVRLLDPVAWDEVSGALGPEPLDASFTARRLGERLALTRRAVKEALMDPRIVVGVGNIYAAEALHAARIHPGVPAAALDSAAVGRLHRALRRQLRAAIAAGGTTARDYVLPDGTRGGYAERLAVYGRAGEPCTTCGQALERSGEWGGRTTVWCAHCQRAGSAR